MGHVHERAVWSRSFHLMLPCITVSAPSSFAGNLVPHRPERTSPLHPTHRGRMRISPLFIHLVLRMPCRRCRQGIVGPGVFGISHQHDRRAELVSKDPRCTSSGLPSPKRSKATGGRVLLRPRQENLPLPWSNLSPPHTPVSAWRRTTRVASAAVPHTRPHRGHHQAGAGRLGQWPHRSSVLPAMC